MAETVRSRTMELELRWGEQTVFLLRVPEVRGAVPPEAAAHLREAGRHTLLSLRTMLDSAIRGFDGGPPPAKKSRVKVE